MKNYVLDILLRKTEKERGGGEKEKEREAVIIELNPFVPFLLFPSTSFVASMAPHLALLITLTF